MNDLVSTIQVSHDGVFMLSDEERRWGVPSWLWDALTFGESDSGERVNPNTALGHGPVWHAVNILAGDLGQLPVHKMVRDGENVEKDRTHPTEILLNDGPNSLQTPSIWKETMMQWALLWGNGISGIVRQSGRPAELVPLLPDRTHCEKLDDYDYLIVTRIDGKRVELLPEDTVHIRGLASDGFWGLSAVQVARNVIGHGLALQRHGNSVFRNGAVPRGVLEHPGKLNADARANLRSEWNRVHGGSDNAGKIAVLWENMKYHAMSMSNEDAEWLAARKLDREFVASLFGLPAFKLNALENSAVRANLEEQNRDYFNTSLSRWTNRFAEEFKRKLLTQRERRSGDHFFRWFPEAFLKGDTTARFQAYALAKSNRIMTTNEVRAKEDMNPIEGGDTLENPAIDTRESVSDEQQREEPDAADNEDAPPEDTARRAIRSMVTVQVDLLIKAECDKASRLAKGKSTTNTLDKFYGSYVTFAEPFLAAADQVAKAVGIGGDDWQTVTATHAAAARQAWEQPATARQVIEKVQRNKLIESLIGEETNG